MTARSTRRQLFGASAAMLLVGSTGAGEAKAVELDGALLAACAEYYRAHAAWMGPFLSDDETDRLGGVRTAAISRVHDLPPRTPEGLQAKARVALRAIMWDIENDCLDCVDIEQKLALDVLRDLVGETRT